MTMPKFKNRQQAICCPVQYSVRMKVAEPQTNITFVAERSET